MSDQSTILCTHHGRFQADEVLATAILQRCFPHHRLVRSREPRDWQQADIVYDVGGQYDGVKFFDHHQKDFAECRANGIVYAAAGLIWRHFGQRYCQPWASKHQVAVAELTTTVDRSFIAAIDAHDNGMTNGGFRLRNSDQALSVRHFSTIIANLNPLPLLEASDPASYQQAFHQAVALADQLLIREVLAAVARLKTGQLVLAADQQQPLLILDQYCPWQGTVVRRLPHVKLVIYPSPEGTWQLQAVPKVLGQFVNRLDLPKAWAGLNDNELQQVTGVSDAIFCHRNRFIAGCHSRQGAQALAELALAYATTHKPTFPLAVE